MKRVPMLALIATVGFAAGMFVDRQWLALSDPDLLPWSPPRPRTKQRVWSQVEAKPSADPVECPETATVIVVAGQSNAANSVGQRSRATGKVFWRYDGRCYPAIDPMPGSEGSFGSVWPRVGDEMIRSGLSQAVVFIGAAMGGTSISQWADSEGLGSYLRERLVNEPRIDLVLWHQGEFDRATPAAEYASDLGRVLAAIRSVTAAPVLVAQASICGGTDVVEGIRSAQHASVDSARAIFSGPDIDRFKSFEDRYDDCDLSPSGAAKVSHAWVTSIVAARAPR